MQPLVEVRATVSLSELPVGSHALVNVQSLYIQSLLKCLYLIPVKP